MVRRFCLVLPLMLGVAACLPANEPSETATHEISLFGFTEPNVTVDVAFSQPGRVQTLHVEEGQQVAEGELLATLDEGSLAVSQAIAEARVSDESAIAGARAAATALEQRLSDLSELKISGGASPEEVRRVATERDVARAKLATAEAEKEVQRLEVDRLAVEREQRKLRSPLSGYVTEIDKRPGEYVSTNEPQVLELVQLNPLKVRFYVPARQALELQADQDVSLQFPLLERVTSGRIRRVSPVIDPESGTTLVEVVVANPELTIRSGLRCEWRIGGHESYQHANQDPE